MTKQEANICKRYLRHPWASCINNLYIFVTQSQHLIHRSSESGQNHNITLINNFKLFLPFLNWNILHFHLLQTLWSRFKTSLAKSIKNEYNITRWGTHQHITQYPNLWNLQNCLEKGLFSKKLSYYTISKLIHNMISSYILNTSTFKKHLTTIVYFFPQNLAPENTQKRNKKQKLSKSLPNSSHYEGRVENVETLLTVGLWIISLVIQIFSSGNCFLAS